MAGFNSDKAQEISPASSNVGLATKTNKSTERKSEQQGGASSCATPSATSPRELAIDFKALELRILEITHSDIRKITTDTLEAFKKRTQALNENIQNPLMKEKDWQEEMTDLENLIMGAEAQIKTTTGDSTSIQRAQVVFNHIKAACDVCKAQWIPASAPMVGDSPFDWQTHRLRMEQQLLLNSPLQALFHTALTKIATKAQSDHKLSKGIFICYAKPDEKEPHLHWVVPFLEHLRAHLQTAGFSQTKLDTKDKTVGEAKHVYLKGIETDDFVFLMGTPSLRQQYDAEEPALHTALNFIQRKIQDPKTLGQRRVFPLLLNGTLESSFPAMYASYEHLDLSHRSEKSYFRHLSGLIAHLYHTAEETFQPFWDEFLAAAEKITEGTRLLLSARLPADYVLAKLKLEQAQQCSEDRKRTAAGLSLLRREGAGDFKETKQSSFAVAPNKQAQELSGDTWHLPPRNDQHFTGRVAELKKLDETFAAKKEAKAMILSAVSGLGGVGKTQLAIYHLHHPEHPYALRIWFQAETDTILHKEYLEFAQYYKLPLEEKAPRSEVIQAVKRYLAQQPSWLAVYDNAGNYHEIKEFLLDELNNGHRIITTRRTEWHGKGNKLEVNVFSEAEAIAYLKKVIPRDDKYTEAEEKALTALVYQLGCLPLALAQAGAYIETTGILVSDYLELYHQSAIELLKDTTLPIDSNVLPVAITWDISLKAIQAEEQNAGDPPLSLPVLQAMSYLAPDHIPRSLLDHWLIQSPFIKTDQVVGLQFNKAIKRLLAYSMIQTHLEQKTLSVHRLVQEVVRFPLQQAKNSIPAVTSVESKSDAKSTTAAEQSLHSFLLASLTHSSVEEFNRETQVLVDEERQKALLPHLQALIKHHDTSGSSNLPSVYLEMLLGSIGYVFNLQEDVCQAKLYYERALKIQEQRYGKDHWDIESTMNLGLVRLDSGDMQQAKILLEQALSLSEKYYVKDHPNAAKALVNLGLLHLKAGDMQQGKTLLGQALPLLEKYYGKDHPHVATALMNLAWTYVDSGDMQQGKILLERALPVLEKNYGKEHALIAGALRNLSLTYKELGDEKQASSLAQQSYTLFLKVYPDPFHPRTQEAKKLAEMAQLELRIGPLCQPDILKLLQQKEESAVSFFKDQGVNFNEPEIHRVLMLRYVRQQNIQGAIFHGQTLLRLLETREKPESSIHQNLACYYHADAHEQFAAKNHSAAQAAIAQAEFHFKRAIKLLPSMTIYAEYANFLLRQQRVIDVIVQLQYALNKTFSLESPGTTATLSYQSLERATLSADLQAELDYWKRLTLKAIHFAHYLLVIAYLQYSDQSSATVVLVEFQELAGPDNNPLMFSLLGHAYRAVGDYSTAITHYQRALELKPDYTVAKQQLAYCKQCSEASRDDGKSNMTVAALVDSKRAEVKTGFYQTPKFSENNYRLFASVPSTLERKGDSKGEFVQVASGIEDLTEEDELQKALRLSLSFNRAPSEA